jgi:ribonuclease-3 family protein
LERFLQDKCDPGQLSPLTLAFLGDAVFEIYARERLVCMGSRPVSELHRLAVRDVCCSSQADAARRILPCLTEEEATVFRRGKNAHPGHVPKNADPMDYHEATALEALFGYLYLTGRTDRLGELFEKIKADCTAPDID